MAQPFVTGPCHFFVGRQSDNVSAGGTPLFPSFGPFYLGTAERSPNILIRPAHLPLFNDLAGPLIPFDEAFCGEEAFASTNLTRWNESTYKRVASRPSADGNPGSYKADYVGTLTQTEGAGLTIWCQFPYSKYAAYTSMPAGYRFLSCTAYGPDDLNLLGTNPRRLHLLFHALPIYKGALFTFYDFNMTAIQGVSTL